MVTSPIQKVTGCHSSQYTLCSTSVDEGVGSCRSNQLLGYSRHDVTPEPRLTRAQWQKSVLRLCQVGQVLS